MNDNHSQKTGAPLLPRAVGATLGRALHTHPVVILTGARQTGKSTLVGMATGDGRYHVTLDDPDAFEDARADPIAFVTRAPMMAVDEVQRVPELLHAIKRVVDAERPRTHGRFLLTGSANLAIMKNVSESLAGRAAYLTVWPFARRELLGAGTMGVWGELIATPATEWYDLLLSQVAPSAEWREVVSRGGYPTPAYEYDTPAARREWFVNYARTYLQRDVPELADIAHMPDFRRLMRAIALRLGTLQNQTGLGRDTGLPQPTVHRYMNLLETSYQLVRLPAYSVNRTKRLVKTPKLYWNDTALAMSLAGEHEPRGEHLENMVLADLLAWRETEPVPPEIMYWRTVSAHEVDFVVETPEGRLLAVEVKATARPSTKMVAPMRTFMEEYGDRVLGGLVLHTGDDMFWISPRVLAVPWWKVL